MAIRAGHITIDGTEAPTDAPRWDPARYEQVVARILRHVFTSDVGQVLLGQIRRELRILPALEMWSRAQKSPADTFTDAYAVPDDWQAATARGVLLDPGTNAGLLGPRGTGQGSAASIRYLPSRYFDSTNPEFPAYVPERGRPREGDADVVLVHEMTHAVQMMAGVLDRTPIGWDWDDFCEFCAGTVANMYATERMLSPRYAHRGVPQTVLRDPFHYTHYGIWEAVWLQRFRDLQPGFTVSLARLERVPYNPFRDGGDLYGQPMPQYRHSIRDFPIGHFDAKPPAVGGMNDE